MLPIVPLNWLAIVLAAIVAVIIGVVWYSPMLFSKAWTKSMGWKQEEIEKMRKKMTSGAMATMYLKVFISSLITAFVLSAAIHMLGIHGLINVSELAILLWLGFVATVKFGDVLFEGKDFNYYLITSMYYFVSFLVMAWILVKLY